MTDYNLQIDKFLEACIVFNKIHPSMGIPQMIYSTIVTNKLRLSSLYDMDIEDWTELMHNAINNENEEVLTIEDRNKFLNKK